MEELTFRVLPTLQVVHHLVPLKSFRSFQPSIGICHPGVAMGWCDRIEGGPFFGPRPKIGRVGMEPRKLSGEHGVD